MTINININITIFAVFIETSIVDSYNRSRKKKLGKRRNGCSKVTGD